MRPARERRLQLRQGQEEAITLVDAAPPRLPNAPGRIVSVVPALTASLFDLGLGARLVGRTADCLYPAAAAAVPVVGPARDPAVARVLALQPEVVLAGAETTPPAVLAALSAAAIPTWVTGAASVRAALNQLWALVRLCDAPQAGHSLAALERSYEITRQAALDAPPSLVFCPLGRAPDGAGWVVPGRDSYLTDLLATCGGESVPVQPGPEPSLVTPAELAAAAPDIILLPGDPGPFTEAEVAALADRLDLPAVAAGRVYLMDGALLTWPGTHVARALAELPAVLHIPYV